MAFMIPQYVNEPFVLIEYEGGDYEACPAHVFDESGRGVIVSAEIVEGKWFTRLSAPGYLDCTEWTGPFDSEAEARNHIVETFEVDPDTGEELPDD